MGRWITGVLSVLAILVVAKGYAGWHQARSDAPDLIVKAASLIAQGRSAADLGQGRIEQLLAIQDPNFYRHNGVDFMTSGANNYGTVTQALAPRVTLASMVPGVTHIGRVTYALALDERMPKTAQLALYLDQVEMGYGPDGEWITGFFNASQAVYGRPPAALSQEEFLILVAVLVAPSELPMAAPNETLQSRVARLNALVNGHCAPHGARDIWLDGCA